MQGPYRPQTPPPDPELARLAAQGERRRMEVAAGQQMERQASGGVHLRTAIGAYRGSTIKRVVLVALVGGILFGVLGVTLSGLGELGIGQFFIPGFGVAFISVFGMAFIPPLASKGAVAAEQDWVMALPFQLTGYFDVLSREPTYGREVVYRITWRGDAPPPDPNLVNSVFGAVDPAARLEHADVHTARIRSGTISGSTGIMINRQPVLRNHRFCTSIHGVVEQVLLPLHRTYPIAQVTVV